MTFADDTAKTTGTQIRKTYISLKSFHLKADNRIRFISETCRQIVTIRLGKKIIYNADTQPVSRRALARIPRQLRGEKSLCLQCDPGDSQLSSLRAESKGNAGFQSDSGRL